MILTVDVCDAVLRQARRLRDGTHGERLLRGKGVQRALEARCDLGQDHAALSPEALRATVDQGNDCGRIDFAFVVGFHHPHNQTVEPAARFDVVQARDDQFELAVEIFVSILHHALVRSHYASRNAFHDEVCGCLGFTLAHVAYSEKKLSVQVADVNSVQICNLYKGTAPLQARQY